MVNEWMDMEWIFSLWLMNFEIEQSGSKFNAVHSKLML